MNYFNGTDVALGTVARKPFSVGYVYIYMPLFFVMTITDEGDSDLLSFAEGQLHEHCNMWTQYDCICIICLTQLIPV